MNASRPSAAAIRRQVVATLHRLYGWSTAPFGWWPIAAPRLGRRPGERRKMPSARLPHVAYHLWHFPVLSQTFVQREVGALKQRGLPLTVFAEGAEDLELLDAEGLALHQATRYLDPADPSLLGRYRREFFRARPLRYLNLFLFVMSRRYGLAKRPARDRKMFANALFLAGCLREAGVDRIHAPWADRCAFTAMLAARLLDLPYSVQVRAHDLHDPSYQPPLRDILRNADFVITNTRYNRPFIRAHMGRSGPAVHTIYNGIDLGRFQPPPRPRRSGDPMRIVCVARLIEQKGLVHLLEAAALLRDRGLAFQCEIIGGPEEPRYTQYLRRLERMHRDLGLERSVSFRGARPFADVMDALRAADVFVLPCVIAADGRRDVTPNALIEAMAMKLPVVATTVTGIPEIVEAGVSGLLVEPGDAAALADGVERIARDAVLAAELGENARRRVESRFDVHANVGEYLRLFSPRG